MGNTYDHFLKEVKQQYELEKNGVYGGFLLNPSPAQLRNLSLLLFDNGLPKSDEEVFRIFFKAQDEEFGLRKKIDNFDVEKLRAICNFLKGKSERTNINSLNLIAILVDYKVRPYNKFLIMGSLPMVELEPGPINVFQISNAVSGNKQVLEQLETNNQRIDIKKISKIGMVLILLFTCGYFIKQEFFPMSQCMQWKEDHYESVECNTVNQGIASFHTIIPLEEREFYIKKIQVNEKTTFFKNGKPQIWYGKIDGKIVYFNTYGTNPENGKPLKPITKYIISKYILREK